MMRDEVLGTLNDPRQIADTQLTALPQRQRDCQPRRIAERAETIGQPTQL
jgi:hypothetical protein